ncbi:MAG TPA: hypothetical protein PK079_08670 [Leptospiraceae bacterium]|nr:hypothetical protein [Leptospiraceae bacterium]HMW04278.1 hypothetical protein [Leptospiraceae bacterium]HMX30624.1 hypothetical protein [Leptospiraceae bacterium]HMY31324.1 hypothetical protein [Leptospiraceae bacterium]HMZ63437.1 hypothetical protein [Leptospiraceae bacterium]
MLWQKIKSIYRASIDFCKNLLSKIFSEAVGETKSNKFRFFFISSSAGILFFIIFILVGKNPFSLLVPFYFYDLPSIDKRTEITLFISDGKNNLLKSKRKVLLAENDLRRNLNIIIGELSQAPYEDVIETTEENVFPKKLPNIRNPILISWFLESEKKLIIDLDEEVIQKEISNIRIRVDANDDDLDEKQKKEEEELEKKRYAELQVAKMKILNTTLQALEKTIFANFPSIESIEFKINGHSKELAGLEYKLSEIKKRN